MRYYPTREFNTKLTLLETSQLSNIRSLIQWIEDKDQEIVLRNSSLLGSEVYVIKSDDINIYFVISSDKEGDYLLLLDIAFLSKRVMQEEFIAAKDPRKNRSLNPAFNRGINPAYNRSINPAYNRSINPAYNRSINPAYNRSINPAYNRSINPAYNRSINPAYNHSINPAYNHSINPAYNRGFGGPFIYSKDLEQIGYVIQAKDQVKLLFDMSSKFNRIGVQSSSDIVITFDKNNKWDGYWIPAANGIYLLYSDQGTWTGMVI